MKRLSNAQVQLIRKQITSHHEWKAYSVKNKLSSAQINSTVKVLEVVRDLGLDIENIIGADNAARAGFWAESNTSARRRVIRRAADHDKESDDKSETRASQLDVETVRSVVREEIEATKPRPLVIYEQTTGERKKVTGRAHEKFPLLLQACAARDVKGYHLNVFLTGPTGSGKTHSASQVAETMGVNFYEHGALEFAEQLLGRVVESGEYLDTPFIRCFRNGGVVILDEIDAWDNNALLALNGALASGRVTIATGEVIPRHPDCVIIAAGNTLGTGPSAVFVGRNQLDGASLSRFPVLIAWDYDCALESEICGNASWAREIQLARAACFALGLSVIIDPRKSIAGAALLASGVPRQTVRELTYLASLEHDDRESVMKQVRAAYEREQAQRAVDKRLANEE